MKEETHELEDNEEFDEEDK
jgi:hypothetical protein